jgi:cellulose synthase operon protein YhjQ
MSDHKGQSDQNPTPDDVATLYSWANLHGAKYRDFSASRAQIRETARLRVQEATEAERQGVSEPTLLAMSAEARRAAERERGADAQRQEWEAQQAAHQSASLAAQVAAHRFAEESAQQAAVEAAARAAQHRAAMEAAQLAAKAAEQRAAQEAAQRAAEAAEYQAAQQSAHLAFQAAEQRAAQEAAQRAAEAAEYQAAQEAAQLAYQAAEQRAAQEAAQRAAQEAEHQAAQEAARRATQEAEQRAAKFAAELAALKAEQAAQKAAEEAARQTPQQPAWQQPLVDRVSPAPASNIASPAAPYEPPAPQPPFQRVDYPGFESGYERPPQGYIPPVQAFSSGPGQPPVSPSPLASPSQVAASKPPAPPQPEAIREEPVAPPRLWPPADSRESSARPAWLTPGPAEAPVHTPPLPAAHPPVSPDTLQGSRDRLASRWFALRGVFEGGHAPVEQAPAPAAARAPVMAVFSLAGGVGKTSLVATLGRALSARGERVLLVDTAAFGLLPFFFGARDQRPGQLRTFSPPGVSSDAPIQMVTIDPESLGPEPAGAEAGGLNGLAGEISRHARGSVGRVIVDLATASGATTRKLIRMAPMILVPVTPDMNSVVSVTSIDDFFEHNSPAGSKVPLYYVMNQFDPSLPLHLDIREVLRQQLGDRLLPFALRRTPAVSEALAEGMTVMDYAPNSTVAEDYGALAGWVKSLSAPASTTYRGVRWSER